ncbi:uncharacterized protein BKA78DRAFT_307353 [Phyllosticta capitalensis]|uniref:uncharacterized protein n=1 Tax=Phyllosticta capitalensis TaxID=121624 RepID=UPI003132898B
MASVWSFLLPTTFTACLSSTQPRHATHARTHATATVGPTIEIYRLVSITCLHTQPASQPSASARWQYLHRRTLPVSQIGRLGRRLVALRAAKR